MNKDKREHLVGHPSDYGSRTLEDLEKQSERGEVERTADGDPLTDRGTAESAISHEPSNNEV